MLKQNSIRKKIILSNLWNLLIVTIAFILISFILDFYDLNQELKDIETDYLNIIKNKGNLIVTSNENALIGMVEDYAFSAVNDFVSSTVDEDDGIVYGIYMDTKLRPWVIAGNYFSEKPLKNDSLSLWANNITMKSQIEFDNSKSTIYEFALPIFSDNEKVGTIRYGLSTELIEEKIAKTKIERYKKSFLHLLIILLVTLVIFFISMKLSRKRAHNIISPLYKLTGNAELISQGDYSKEIQIKTNDEINILSNALEKMRKTIKDYTENLESLVDKRTEELKKLQSKLIEQAHKTGMAEIATAVLHNVGNTLNSVVISSESIKDVTQNTFLNDFKKANDLLKKNEDNLSEFIHSKKGKMLIKYFDELEKMLGKEIKFINKHVIRVIKKTNLIKDIIEAQQNFATTKAKFEKVRVNELIDDVLKLEEETLKKYNIHVKRNYSKVPKLYLGKTKFVHIIINIMKNAKEAMEKSNPKIFSINIYQKRNKVFISFTDTGKGIPKSNLEHIFSHGFSTKEKGHGFGLHSCANYLNQMKAKISAKSEGSDKGAEFIITFDIEENYTLNNRG